MDNISNPLTRDFTFCLDSFGLQQFVSFPRHFNGLPLDLTRCSGITPSDCEADIVPLSDHMLSFTVNLTLSKSNPPRIMSHRNIKDINMDTPITGINSLPSADSSSIPDELASLCNDSLHNNLAPLKTRSVTFTCSSPGYTPVLDCLRLKSVNNVF